MKVNEFIAGEREFYRVRCDEKESSRYNHYHEKIKGCLVCNLIFIKETPGKFAVKYEENSQSWHDYRTSTILDIDIDDLKNPNKIVIETQNAYYTFIKMIS